MKNASTNRLWNTNRDTLLRVILAALFIIPLVLVTPKAEAAPKVQPDLLQLATTTPNAPVQVIVQKTGTGQAVEQEVSNLGGSVTKDLHIINAFGAQMEAGDAIQLARMDSVRWISMDSPVIKSTCSSCIDTSNLSNNYIKEIRADQVWNEGPNYLQGQGMTVAVVDSGMASSSDLQGPRVRTTAKFNSNTNSAGDGYGHGSHVAGIIGGSGANSNGQYIGVAPRTSFVNVKVSDDQGAAAASDVVNGLQWVNDNRTRYNIKVVNLSLNSSVATDYNTDPLDAAVEILWFNGIVVVVSAGNSGTTGLYAPANDPFVITVGAMDDKGTLSTSDDTLAGFSAFSTSSALAKPDLVAPGTDIVSVNAGTSDTLDRQHPANIVNNDYFRMSGTSMAAPMVSGAALLLLQDEPNLTPDQVKYRLKATARPLGMVGTGAGYLDVYAAVHGTTTASANTGLPASQLLWSGGTPVTWGSVNWNSVNWNSVNWNSVNWNSVNWNSVNWNSDYWRP